MALVGNYVENLTDPMVIVDEAYQFDGQIFLIIVGILRIFFLARLVRINMEPPSEPPISNSKIDCVNF